MPWKPTHICMNQTCPTNCYAGATWTPYSQEDLDMPDPIACDYCGENLYPIDDQTKTKTEIVLFSNHRWKITLFVGRKSGWILGDRLGDNWVRYDNGDIVYDAPHLIPAYIKGRLRVELGKLERLGNTWLLT